jgi:hypothetical protein
MGVVMRSCSPESTHRDRPVIPRSNDTPSCERDTVELVEHGLVEALANAVCLRALGLGACVIDVLDRKIELILMPLRVTTVLAATIGQHPHELHVVALEQRDHTVIEQIRRSDRGLAILQFGTSHFGVGVDKSLLIDASDPLQVADLERV